MYSQLKFFVHLVQLQGSTQTMNTYRSGVIEVVANSPVLKSNEGSAPNSLIVP